MNVVQTLPNELSKDCIFTLNIAYEIQLQDFVVLYRKNTLYLNPEKLTKIEMKNIVKCVNYEGYDLCDITTKNGRFLAGFYDKYGWNSCNMIIEAQQKVMDKKRKKWADEQAKKIYPKMMNILSLEDESGYCDKYDEYLAYSLAQIADETGIKTNHNLMSYSYEVIYWLGYLKALGLFDIE